MNIFEQDQNAESLLLQKASCYSVCEPVGDMKPKKAELPCVYLGSFSK